MDLLGSYGSGSSDEDENEDKEKELARIQKEKEDADKKKKEDAKFAEKMKLVQSIKAKNARSLMAAPLVALDLKESQIYVSTGGKVKLNHNPTAEQLWKPVMGPVNPYADTTLGADQGHVQNAVTGFAEKTHFDNFHFEEQYNTYMRRGYAVNPSENSTTIELVGDELSMKEHNGQSVAQQPKRILTAEEKELRKKRQLLSSDPSDVDNFQGPWASYLFQEEKEPEEITDEQIAHAAMQEKKKRRKQAADDDEGVTMEEQSEFHGKELFDYQGRSYVHPPSTLKPVDHKCYIPKKHIHTWAGHTKGVNSIQFFPQYGHILLSASMDSTIKIWDVYNNRKCLRTYYGHTEAVRAIDFAPDGKRFISVSYDRYMKYWDTETGQLISKHTSKKLPFCGKIYPANENEVLVGQGDKLVVQWDMRANEIVQKYDEHLGPVNSVCIMDENRRFISTSDDKKVYMWEYGVPVVIKHIAEPDMHSMPFTALHPSGNYWVGQSQDNQIVVYGAVEKVKLNSRKRFRGHLTAGYACQIGFSPCSKYIYSGDAEGRVFFWDWRTQRIYRKLKAHDQVCIGAVWHPIEQSRMATCSWDGTIKYWD